MMQLGTRLECVGSSPMVSRACLDGTREFARRRPRLIESLSMIAQKLIGSWEDDGPRSSLGIEPISNDVVGSHWEFARRFTEGIGKLAGNTLGDRQKKTG
ncbi:hypothetical protein B296_00015752 [Ensete ventricosum]|uniref:Uncharacterized protein n=1 Tax=Ensete ventricosum TaxID=4639 RepID=A0A426YQL0_ENSVE|nr:hypothetical protein B296_00015752 [Ensete ventricosum]